VSRTERRRTEGQSKVLRWRIDNDSINLREDSSRRKRHWSGVQLDKRPWLQLMCCTPVSGHDVSRVFWSRGKSLEKRS